MWRQDFRDDEAKQRTV